MKPQPILETNMVKFSQLKYSPKKKGSKVQISSKANKWLSEIQDFKDLKDFFTLTRNLSNVYTLKNWHLVDVRYGMVTSTSVVIDISGKSGYT